MVRSADTAGQLDVHVADREIWQLKSSIFAPLLVLSSFPLNSDLDQVHCREKKKIKIFNVPELRTTK